jgi:hypothetical protein
MDFCRAAMFAAEKMAAKLAALQSARRATVQEKRSNSHACLTFNLLVA